MKSKKCFKCGYTKPLEAFHRDRYREDGRCATCSECANRLRNEKRKEKKDILVEYKGGRCEVCGRTGPSYIFDFHHKNKNEKDFGISDYVSRSIENLKIEVDKCMLVCCLCHRKIHAEEM